MVVESYRKNRFRRTVTRLTLAVMFFCLPCDLLYAEDYDFWVQTPTNWTNKTDRLGKDLKKQVMSPAGDAFIEVYAAEGNNISAQAIADGMEQAMRQRDTAYLQNRISSQNIQADGQPAVLREYTGQYNGIPLRAYALYAYGNGGGFAVFGVFVTGQSAKYQNMVYTCVTSLRFSPPGQATASAGNSPYKGGGSPYAGNPYTGCNAIVGKWKWFTGSTAEFGPNGSIPGNGHHWECLDNGRTFKISWDNGRWIDTLTLTENGSRLEGRNQAGNRVWGTRIKTAQDSGGNDGMQGGGAGGQAAPGTPAADTACCSYYGTWNFVPPGIHGKFMPDHQYTERSKGFRYDCAGGQVTIHWGSGGSTTWQRKNKDLMVRKDKYGSLLKATRLTDEVTYKGKSYKACSGDTGALPSGVNPIPSANRTKKISGNMAAQWGFAHGSLKPGDPSRWELATVSGVTLNFQDPYKQGKQHFTVQVYNPSGGKVAETAVGMSAALSLPPGTYTLEISTGIHYAGWRCEWK